MCDTPDDPPESSIKPINDANIPTFDKNTVENRQKVKADFERELLIVLRQVHVKTPGSKVGQPFIE